MILPEILLHIALFLDRPDLLVSVRVCKAWHEILTPCIYYSVDIHQSDYSQRKSDHSPSASAIRRFGHYVRTMTLCLPCEMIDELALSVRQLRSLHIQSDYNSSPDTVNGLAEDVRLLLLSNNIQQLHFDLISSLDKFHVLSHCILQHGALQVANIELRGIAKSFSDRNLALPGIKMLHLNGCCERGLQVIVDWLSICPQLEEFYVSRLRDEPLEQNLAFDILSELKGLCPKLRRIELCGVYLERTQLPKVIMCFPGLTHIRIKGSYVGGTFFRTLEDRFSYLTCLELYDWTGIKQWMTSLILFSCPRLVQFVCPLVSTVHYPHSPQPSQSSVLETSGSRRLWACSGLKRLETDYFMWSHNLEWNARAMEQLEALKDLEVLVIASTYFDVNQMLAQEGTLVNIAAKTRHTWELWSPGQFTRAQLKERDNMRWMVDAWPKLKHFWYHHGGEYPFSRSSEKRET